MSSPLPPDSTGLPEGVTPAAAQAGENEADALLLQLEDLRCTINQEIKCMQEDFMLQLLLQQKENERIKELLADLQAETNTTHNQMLKTAGRLKQIEEEIGHG